MLIRKLYLTHSLAQLSAELPSSSPIMVKIQELLTTKEYLQPTTENKSSVHTNITEAVARFQEAEGMPATGMINPITYCRLLPAEVSELASTITKPRANFILPRANVLITKSERRLTLFDGNKPLRQYPVGIGKPATPTPSGDYAIAVKILNPGGVLGTRWLGLNFDSYGIHGTNAPWLIGQLVSKGCIRMHNSNVEELYNLIKIGTPVYIRD